MFHTILTPLMTGLAQDAAETVAVTEDKGLAHYLTWDSMQGWLMPLLFALAILIIGRMVAKVIRGLLHSVLVARGVDATLTGFLEGIAYMLLMAMVAIAAIQKLGVDTTSFAAILAAAGFAIGMALQGSLGNLASGVMLILFRPFKAGDFVEIAGQAGVVLEVQVFATVLKSGDNKRITIPNGAITGGTIVNYSAHDTRRVDMVFGCGYGDDILKAKALLMDILEKDERVLAEPAPSVALAELADSSVNFNVRPWVKAADYWDVRASVHEQVKLRFDAEGLEIPFPQRDVHMHQAG